MEDIFLKEVKINNVRHLKEINISLSGVEKKHLILTGKNGSGKTSVLDVLKEYFEALEGNHIQIKNWEGWIRQWELTLRNPSETEPSKHQLRAQIKQYASLIEKHSRIELSFNRPEIIYPAIQDGQFMFVHFPPKRGDKYNVATGPQKLNLETQPNSITKKFNQYFLQYLVNLKTERSFARDEENKSITDSIDKWFVTFEKTLKELYGENVTLDFDRKEWNFYLLIDGYERFDLNHLSDGYSAIINIISELLLRMEKYNYMNHEMQGIVLIDEIETHLHIELQRKILPFLTTFFPKLQFIVTTHSPFVLNSVSNAVIFDLEKRERIEDMSGYSAERIIETYFDADQYSDLVKKKVAEYEELSNKEALQDADAKRFAELEKYFNKFPLSLSPELSLKINDIRLKKIA